MMRTTFPSVVVLIALLGGCGSGVTNTLSAREICREVGFGDVEIDTLVRGIRADRDAGFSESEQDDEVFSGCQGALGCVECLIALVAEVYH